MSYPSLQSEEDSIMGMNKYAFTYTHGKEIMNLIEFGRKMLKNMEELDILLKEGSK